MKTHLIENKLLAPILVVEFEEKARDFKVFNDEKPYVSYFVGIETKRFYLPIGKWEIIGYYDEIKEEDVKDLVEITCFVCGGDGKETCTNPDHGFIEMLSFHDVGRLGCPVCGHHPHHKVKNGGNCECCNGVGKLNYEIAMKMSDEYGYDDYFDFLTTFNLALESEIYWENPYGNDYRSMPDVIDSDCRIVVGAKYGKWYEAQSRTFDKSRTIILKKL